MGLLSVIATRCRLGCYQRSQCISQCVLRAAVDSSRMTKRLDLLLLNRVYQPLADLIWRYSGKSRFFVAWLCFGTSFVAVCLDLYSVSSKGGPSGLAAVFGSPLPILLLMYLSTASANMDRHSHGNMELDSLDRFIRAVTMLSVFLFVFIDIVSFLETGSSAVARQTLFCVVYSFTCSSALYFIEAKPPSAALTWNQTSDSGR